jgi:plasmid stabilization system protein ParE
MLPLIWAPRALVKLQKIHDRIASADPLAAQKLKDRIIKASSLLQTSPELGEKVSGTRFDHAIDKTLYVLIYEANAKRVRIVALVHGRRDARRNRGPRKK